MSTAAPTPSVPKHWGPDTHVAALRASRAYLLIALGLVAIVAWGFWPSYFGPLLRNGVNRHWVIHVHAAVFVGWLLLLVTQASLIAIGQPRLHRRVGQAGMAYGVLVLLMGTVVSIAMPVIHVQAHQMRVERAALVVLYNLADIIVFGAFFVAAMIWRRTPEWHKRLILSATVALAAAAVGRVLPSGSLLYVLVWLSPLFASMAVDVWIRRRIHPVSLISIPIFTISLFKVDLIALSPIWSNIGRAIIGHFV